MNETLYLSVIKNNNIEKNNSNIEENNSSIGENNNIDFSGTGLSDGGVYGVIRKCGF